MKPTLSPRSATASSAGLKRPRPDETALTASRALIHEGHRDPRSGKLLSETTPLRATLDTFDEHQVLDLSKWTAKELAAMPSSFYTAFPVEEASGLQVRVSGDMSRLPPDLLRRPIERLTFVRPEGIAGGANAPRHLDLTRIKGPPGRRCQYDLDGLENVICVAPQAWHAEIRNTQACTLLDPGQLAFDGLSRSPLAQPDLPPAYERAILKPQLGVAEARIATHLIGSRQLDLVGKASFLHRVYARSLASPTTAEHLTRHLLALATDEANPPSAVELRHLCQMLAHLIVDSAGVASSAIYLLAALQLAGKAPFPSELGRVNWILSTLYKGHVVTEEAVRSPAFQDLREHLPMLQGRFAPESKVFQACAKLIEALQGLEPAPSIAPDGSSSGQTGTSS